MMPGPGRHPRQGDAAQFDDLGATPRRAVGVDRRPPPARRDPHDCCVQHVRHAGGDGELDVAGDQPSDERVDVTGGVGTHHDPLTDLARVVAGAVTDRDLGGELGDRHVDDGELIGTRVRRRVAGSQDPGERFAVIGEAEHRLEPEAALVVRRRALLVLRMDLDQRRVDIQHHRATSPPTCAHTAARASARAARSPSSTSPSMASKVRQIVGSDAT